MRSFLFLLLTLSATVSVGAEKQWHWIKATNTIRGWTVSEGDADISIEGRKLSAHLYSSSDQRLQISLEGNMQNGRVTAKETVQGSDYNGSTYRGTLRTKHWPEMSVTVGPESIVLSDGWGMIGITRAVQK